MCNGGVDSSWNSEKSAPDAVGIHQGKKYMREKWKQLYQEYYVPEMLKLDLHMFNVMRFARLDYEEGLIISGIER